MTTEEQREFNDLKTEVARLTRDVQLRQQIPFPLDSQSSQSLVEMFRIIQFAVINIGRTSLLSGPGAPTMKAGKGSIYLRDNGTSYGDRLYVNTDGGTTWEPVVVSTNYIRTNESSTLTIASGAITVTQSYHDIETEAAGATDDLDTINDSGLADRAILILRAASSSRTVVLKDGTGNLRLAGDFSLDHSRDTITLFGAGGIWYELSRSDNET
jgi:hypothetical protein